MAHNLNTPGISRDNQFCLWVTIVGSTSCGGDYEGSSCCSSGDGIANARVSRARSGILIVTDADCATLREYLSWWIYSNPSTGSNRLATFDEHEKPAALSGSFFPFDPPSLFPPSTVVAIRSFLFPAPFFPISLLPPLGPSAIVVPSTSVLLIVPSTSLLPPLTPPSPSPSLPSHPQTNKSKPSPPPAQQQKQQQPNQTDSTPPPPKTSPIPRQPARQRRDRQDH